MKSKTIQQSQQKVNTLLIPKWKQRTHDTHQIHLKEYSGKSFKVALLGDSMMERWKYTKYWTENLSDYANLGVGGDMVQHLLYRISGENGVTSILDMIKVDKIFLMIGTNNSEKGKTDQIVEGIQKVISTIFEKQPNVELVVYNITVRNDVPDNKIKEINDKVESYIKKSNNPKMSYRYLDMKKEDLVDNVHLNEKGYDKWFDDLMKN